jgi:hypothetical protein
MMKNHLPIWLSTAFLAAGLAPAAAQNQAFANLGACKAGAFSTEEDFMMKFKPFDGNQLVSDGDILSPDGEVCVRNRDLLHDRFDVDDDLGLDGLDILSIDRRLIAFSTELDSPHGNFGAGDLLFTNGAVVPNAALVEAFGTRLNLGLDEVKFVGKTDAILKFAEQARAVPRDAWQGGRLPELLKSLDLDLWFSVEGTLRQQNRLILDGDILSAMGVVIATNQNLLSPGAPAGLPSDGVDFGIDAFAMAREHLGNAEDFSDLFISTELLHNGERRFTDGDVLEQGGGIIAENSALIAAFGPRADFLGLDALWFPFGEVSADPRITTTCDLSVGEFNGGITLPGGSGTGLHESAIAEAGALVPVLERPCGLSVPIDGSLPPGASGVERFRVVYREASEPVPALPGDAATPAIATSWTLNRGKWKFVPFIGFQWVCEKPATLATDAQGWMDASDFLDAKNGTGAWVGCPHELRLAVWNTGSLPAGTADGQPVPGLSDREDAYAVWLEWQTTAAVMVREPVEHHIQLDNTLPVIAPYPDGLQLRMGDGLTVIPACGEAPARVAELQVWGQFSDRFYSAFDLVLKGGTPPASKAYGPHDFYDPDDGTVLVKNTGPQGTNPAGTPQRLRDITLTDLGASAVKCCYYLEIQVYDRSIRHTFDGTFVNDFTGGNHSEAFMTFSADP